MPKLLVYKGYCRSIIINGVKFTEKKRTAIIEDSEAYKFTGRPDIEIHDVKKQEIVAPQKEEVNKKVEEEKVKEEKVEQVEKQEKNKKEDKIEQIKQKHSKKYEILMNKTVVELREMCKLVGVDTKGTKEQLVLRLLSPKEE